LKRFAIPYPLLIAAYPVVAVYAENQSILSLPDVVRPMVVALAGAALLWLLCSLALRDSKRGAAAATTIFLCLFAYDRLDNYLRISNLPAIVLSIWAVGTLALAGLAAWQWRWHSILGVFSLVLLAMPILKVVAFQTSVVGRVVVEKATGKSVVADRPDVVYVVLDGYGRTDAFERYYGFSDRGFVEGLRQRGFYVADQSHANYSQTELSVAATLNLDFAQNIKSIRQISTTLRPYFRDALENSAVAQKFQAKGYQVATIGTDFPPLTFQRTELDLNQEGGLNLLESALLAKTPFRVQQGIWDSQFNKRRRTIRRAFERLGSLGGRRSQPRFSFVHILAPHPPFSFGANGEELKPKGSFGFWDGSDFMEMVGDAEDYRKGYAGQAKFVGREVLKAVDKILRAPGPKPILIIQGDHGPKMKLSQNSLEDTALDECFPILNAYLVPEKVKAELYPEITPVNTFRTLFRTIFGEQLPNLPDRSYFSPYGEPLKFTDVTPRFSPKRT
jgi:hypothetical protein